MWVQRAIVLDPRPRGFHLVTREVMAALPEVGEVQVGLLHLLIQHTSASLALNENASPDVRRDFEAYFNATVPEDAPYWTHTLEGADNLARDEVKAAGTALQGDRALDPHHVSGRRATRRSTREPRNGTPSSSSSTRWRSPLASVPSDRTTRCQGTRASPQACRTAPATRGAPGETSP